MPITTEILQKRLMDFALNCQNLCSKLPKNASNLIYSNQLIRSSSSPGANYIEAIEASSTKEFVLRLKICRKETKESNYWLTLIQNINPNIESAKSLIDEGDELIKIFSSSIITLEKKMKK